MLLLRTPICRVSRLRVNLISFSGIAAGPGRSGPSPARHCSGPACDTARSYTGSPLPNRSQTVCAGRPERTGMTRAAGEREIPLRVDAALEAARAKGVRLRLVNLAA